MSTIVKRYALAVCLLIGSFTTLQAQMVVEGTITDSSDFPASSALVRAGESETESDFDGYYELEVSAADAVNGMVELSISGIDGSVASDSFPYVEGGRVTKDYQLGAIQLATVVAIGYGTVEKDDLTGAVDLITEDDFNEGPVVSPQQMIQGKAAGVQITSGNGAPGAGQNIRIRGVGSLSLNAEPLIVVDGVPISEDGIGGSRNILNSINPNDIASMSVLKDASATAIYGARGGNGVIIIETKKGKKGALKYQLSSQVSFSEVTDYVDVLNGDQVRDYITQNGTDAQIAQLGSFNTDWQDQIYQNAFGWDNNFSVRGGIGAVPFRASLGYTTNEGVLKTDEMDRYTGSINVSPKFLDDNLKVDINVKGSYQENVFADNGAIGNAVGFDPTQSVYTEDGRFWEWYDTDGTILSTVVNRNPLALLEYIDDTSEVRRLIASAKFDYALPWVNGLSAVANMAYDASNSHGRRVVSPELNNASAEFNGSRKVYSQASINRLLDTYLVYDIEGENNSLNVTAGYSYQEFYNRGYGTNYSYFVNDPTLVVEDGFFPSTHNLQSFFGRAQYDYKNKYLITATLRADASSKLNPDDRWGYFPSVAVAWNLHNETAFEDLGWLTNLKLRAGYGEVGNVNGLGNYRYLQEYQQSQNGASYQFGDNFYQTYRPKAYSPNLEWEISNTANIALDYGLFNNRLNGYIDFYIKTTEGLISTVVIDPFINFGNLIDANLGEMENRGVEFDLNYELIKSEDVNWSIGYNIAYNENEITDLGTPVTTGGISGGTGNNIQRLEEGYKANSFWVYQQIYDDNGRPIDNAVVDRNGDGQINDDDRYMTKSPFAPVAMGINTNFSYKSFDLSVVTRANLGNYVYNNTASSNAYLTRFTENGIIRNVHADLLNSNFSSMTEPNLMSDYYLEDASFFRIDNITLGYQIPDTLVENFDIRVFGSVNNVATFTDYSGIDPEVFGGIDNGFYPRPRVWSFGLNVNF